jgi:2-polyprenyl-3-methyl-5-hydroxy-6-metoxy-1,4-benzoquinol methylase
MSTADYSVKEQDYFSNIRTDIVSLIPSNPEQRILEVGAGTGNTLVYIKEKKLAKEVMGVELMSLSGSNQNHPLIDRFQVANIEQEDIKAEKEYFDVIICADVLEHLVDPWSALNKIETHLKKGGTLIVSMPNIREWKTLSKIIFKGDFRYVPEGGIMDRTHLRFFCRKNILELLTTPNLKPYYVTPNFKVKVLAQAKRTRMINRLTLGLFEDFLTVQYIVLVKKN